MHSHGSSQRTSEKCSIPSALHALARAEPPSHCRHQGEEWLLCKRYPRIEHGFGYHLAEYFSVTTCQGSLIFPSISTIKIVNYWKNTFNKLPKKKGRLCLKGTSAMGITACYPLDVHIYAGVDVHGGVNMYVYILHTHTHP